MSANTLEHIIQKTDNQQSPLPPVQKAEKPFASGMGYYKLFWFFMIGSFLGVVVELIYCLVTKHAVESRAGVIYGPFNPVYGFGAVLMALLLGRLANKRDIWIFFGAMLVGGLFEYFCSLWQELSLGTVSWEYSHTPFNLDGRTNLMFSFFWGILGLFWVKDLFPRISQLIERIPKKVGIPLTWLLTAFMVFDMGISWMAVDRQVERHHGIPPQNTVDYFLDRTYPDEFLKKIYPHMIFVNQTTELHNRCDANKNGWS